MDNFLVEKTLSREGCTLHYWVSAHPGRPWLVLLHGAGADHCMFNGQLPILAAKYSLMLPDQRGQGLSAPVEGKLSAALFVEDLLAILAHESITKATFLGHSLGGNLAQEIAYRYPNLVESLALIDCTCNTMKLSAMEKFALKCTGPIMRAYPWKTFLRQSAVASAVQSVPREYLEAVMGAVGKERFIGIMTAGAEFLHHDEDYRMVAPLLLVCGECDGTGNIRKCAPLWAARQACEFHMMKGAGHCAHMDSPDEFNGILEGFLEKHVT